MRATTSLLLACALVTSCAPLDDAEPSTVTDASEDIAVQSDAIRNGFWNDAPYAVGLLINLRASDGATATQACTGIALTSRLILTAAHCLRTNEGGHAFAVSGAVTISRSTITNGTITWGEVYRGGANWRVADTWNADTRATESDVGLLGLAGALSPATTDVARLFDDDPLRLWSYIGTSGPMNVSGWGWGSMFPDSTSCDLSRLVPRKGSISRNTVGNTRLTGRMNTGTTICDGDSGGPWWDTFGSRQLVYALTSSTDRPSNVAEACGRCGIAGNLANGPALGRYLDWIVSASAGLGAPVTSTRFSVVGRDGQSYTYRRFDPR